MSMSKDVIIFTVFTGKIKREDLLHPHSHPLQYFYLI